MLEGEFWVLSARYSRNALNALARAISREILSADVERRAAGAEAYYHIVSVSEGSPGNAVEIGVTSEGFEEGVSRIREKLAEMGYGDPGMCLFTPAEYPHW